MEVVLVKGLEKKEAILTPMERVATPPATKASIGLKLRDMVCGSSL